MHSEHGEALVGMAALDRKGPLCLSVPSAQTQRRSAFPSGRPRRAEKIPDALRWRTHSGGACRLPHAMVVCLWFPDPKSWQTQRQAHVFQESCYSKPPMGKQEMRPKPSRGTQVSKVLYFARDIFRDEYFFQSDAPLNSLRSGIRSPPLISRPLLRYTT